MQFSQNIRRALWIRTLKKVNLERICCQVGFSEDLIAIFSVNMFQIDTKNDKNLRKV